MATASTPPPPSVAKTPTTPPPTAPPATAPPNAIGPAVAPASTTPRYSRWALPLAAVCVLVWLAILVAMAVRTANPVTVNRAQLLESDALVVAVAEPSSGSAARTVTLRVERKIAGVAVPQTVVVPWPDPGRFSAGTAYLVPLRRTEDRTGFLVTPAPMPSDSKRPISDWEFIYPATPDVLRHVEAILETGVAQPYP